MGRQCIIASSGSNDPSWLFQPRGFYCSFRVLVLKMFRKEHYVNMLFLLLVEPLCFSTFYPKQKYAQYEPCLFPPNNMIQKNV